MQVVWLLIALTLSPDNVRPQDLTGEITVTYHQKLNECMTQAIRSEERLSADLKARGMKESYDETIRKAGVVNMAVCWSGKEVQLIYPKMPPRSSYAVIARFTPLTYIDKKTGQSEKVGTGIARLQRFQSVSDCRAGIDTLLADVTRMSKKTEEKVVFCLE